MLPSQASAQSGALDEADRAFLRALVETRSFSNGTPQSIQLTPDGKTVLFLRGEARVNELRLFAFDVESGAERELASAASALAGGESLSPEERARRERMRITARGIVGYQLARGGELVLFTVSGRVFALPLAGGGAQEIAGPDASGAPVFDPQLAPDGSACAFLRGGELWCVSLERSGATVRPRAPRQLTFGSSETLLHGRAEYVAQEELARFRGHWWSPDSRALVYEEVDESGVETLHLQDPAHEFRAPARQAYPRPGRANARWRFGVVSAEPRADGAAPETRWLSFPPGWEYVARVDWPEPEVLLMIALDRAQRELALLAFDASGAVRTLLRERDEVFLNSARELVWLPGGHGFLWSSDAAGELQLFHHDASGAQMRALTAPEFRFTAGVGFDPASGVIFVLRHPTPLASQLWEVRVDAAHPASAAPGGVGSMLAPGWNAARGEAAEWIPFQDASVTAVFARRSRAHVRISTPRTGPPRFEVFRADGTSAGELRSVAESPPFQPRIELAQVGAPPLLAGRQPARDGGFHSLLLRPRSFDPRQRYPVIVQVYGGPHVNTVRAAAAGYALDQWIADHGFLVLRADNRGTPLRGRDWERAISGRFAEVPLEDQIAALQAWAAREPALDLARVGVMGHSFGGYLAALAVLRRPDVFRAAVAGAPVVEWMNYDTAYTERYLGVPPPAGDEVYARNGLLRSAAQEGLAHRPLLLSHGTADDNVHFSESLLLADALFRAGKPFELIPQLGQTHQFHEPALMVRYWERVFRFFKAHL